MEDFRGHELTYDSHNGTDFAVPVGTRVTAAADGEVIRVSNEFHRGGLKLFIDHGCGVVTSYNHLATVEVAAGDSIEFDVVFSPPEAGQVFTAATISL